MGKLVKLNEKHGSLEIDPQGMEQLPPVSIQAAEAVPVCNQTTKKPITRSASQSIGLAISEINRGIPTELQALVS